MEQDGDTPAMPLSTTVVSWQTALWTLLPLALNLWGQPSGRVLSLPSKHGSMLRSFPPLALMDSISLLVSLVYTCFFLHVGPCQSLALVFQERFSSPDQTMHYRQLLREGQRLRWLMFVCGVVQSSIKLNSMTGIFWTKACGASWVFSWLLIEILSFLAPGPTSDSPAEGTPSSSTATDDEWPSYSGNRYQLQLWQAYSKRIHSEYLGIAISIQFWISISMLVHLIVPDMGFPNSLTTAMLRWIIIGYCPLVAVPRWYPKVTMKLGQVLSVGSFIDWWSGTSTVLLFCGLVQWILDHFEVFHNYTRPWQPLFVQYTFCFMSMIVITVMRSILRKVVRWLRSRRLGRYGWPTDINARQRVLDDIRTSTDESDGETLWLAWLLATNFAVWVLWYAYRYNSEGTNNPGWTMVFGK
ncbi:uncharacterized protein LY89DRAFT_729585 [Mollisia scopiformis]|uniref:Uncharacterized protein n=1 Tax=Mollisia scopiformis TaxID=149040 RepID=A0A194XPY2_MOLSC|nr:uncharacterized protein LY89DRAFT_729585 [Mollisia scopiformis]KUJ22114.1 hypothetical protein LY89DRAFT_729585 [Mollisia scopiformis]